MDTETTETAPVAETNGGEGENEVETISIPKTDWEKSQQTIGSLKREIKDLKKSKEEPIETPQTKPDENSLLKKSFLRSAGLSKPAEVDFALDKAKKWNMEVDQLVDDEDFQQALEKFRTKEANVLATSNVRGNANTQSNKGTAEYWVAKGVPPTKEDVPDRKVRVKIARELMDSMKNKKIFYND